MRIEIFEISDSIEENGFICETPIETELKLLNKSVISNDKEYTIFLPNIKGEFDFEKSSKFFDSLSPNSQLAQIRTQQEIELVRNVTGYCIIIVSILL